MNKIINCYNDLPQDICLLCDRLLIKNQYAFYSMRLQCSEQHYFYNKETFSSKIIVCLNNFTLSYHPNNKTIDIITKKDVEYKIQLIELDFSDPIKLENSIETLINFQ